MQGKRAPEAGQTAPQKFGESLEHSKEPEKQAHTVLGGCTQGLNVQFEQQAQGSGNEANKAGSSSTNAQQVPDAIWREMDALVAKLRQFGDPAALAALAFAQNRKSGPEHSKNLTDPEHVRKVGESCAPATQRAQSPQARQDGHVRRQYAPQSNDLESALRNNLRRPIPAHLLPELEALRSAQAQALNDGQQGANMVDNGASNQAQPMNIDENAAQQGLEAPAFAENAPNTGYEAPFEPPRMAFNALNDPLGDAVPFKPQGFGYNAGQQGANIVGHGANIVGQGAKMVDNGAKMVDQGATQTLVAPEQGLFDEDTGYEATQEGQDGGSVSSNQQGNGENSFMSMVQRCAQEVYEQVQAAKGHMKRYQYGVATGAGLAQSVSAGKRVHGDEQAQTLFPPAKRTGVGEAVQEVEMPDAQLPEAAFAGPEPEDRAMLEQVMRVKSELMEERVQSYAPTGAPRTPASVSTQVQRESRELDVVIDLTDEGDRTARYVSIPPEQSTLSEGGSTSRYAPLIDVEGAFDIDQVEERQFPELKREGFGRSVPSDELQASTYPELYERTRSFPGYRVLAAQLEAPLVYDRSVRSLGLYGERMGRLFLVRSPVQLKPDVQLYLDKFFAEVTKLNLVSHEPNEYLRRLLAFKYELVMTNPHIRAIVHKNLEAFKSEKYAFTTIMNKIDAEMDRRLGSDPPVNVAQLFGIVQGFFRCQGDRFKVLVNLVNALEASDFFHVFRLLLSTVNDIVYMLEQLDPLTKKRTQEMIKELAASVRTPRGVSNPLAETPATVVMVVLDVMIADDVVKGPDCEFGHLYVRCVQRPQIGYFKRSEYTERGPMADGFFKAAMKVDLQGPPAGRTTRSAKQEPVSKTFVTDATLALGGARLLSLFARQRVLRCPPIPRPIKAIGGTGLFLRDRQNLLQKSESLFKRFYALRDQILHLDLAELPDSLCWGSVLHQTLFQNFYTAFLDLVKVEITLDADDLVNFKYLMLTCVEGMFDRLDAEVGRCGRGMQAGLERFMQSLERIAEYRNNSSRMSFIHRLERSISEDGRITDAHRNSRLEALRQLTVMIDETIAQHRERDPRVSVNDNPELADAINEQVRRWILGVRSTCVEVGLGFLEEFDYQTPRHGSLVLPSAPPRPGFFLGGRRAAASPTRP